MVVFFILVHYFLFLKNHINSTQSALQFTVVNGRNPEIGVESDLKVH